MSKKSSWIILFLISVIAVQAILLIKQHIAFKAFQHSLPFLIKGETVDYFDLLGLNNQQVSAKTFKDNELSVLFIFDKNCTPCTKSLVYWRKMAGILEQKTAVYGIILGDHQTAADFAVEGMPGFDLYIPVQLGTFEKKFRLEMNGPQTIILVGNTIQSIIVGEMTDMDFSKLIKTIKQIRNGQ